jgi:hypothetical protein
MKRGRGFNERFPNLLPFLEFWILYCPFWHTLFVLLFLPSHSQVSWFSGSIFYYCSPWHIFLSFLLVHPGFVAHTVFPKFLSNVFILDSILVIPPNGLRNFICAASICQYSASLTVQHLLPYNTSDLLTTFWNFSRLLSYLSSGIPSYHFISSIMIYYRLFSPLFSTVTWGVVVLSFSFISLLISVLTPLTLVL